MTYETIRTLSGLIGLISFIFAFALILFWALRSSSKQMADHANIIFKEDA